MRETDSNFVFMHNIINTNSWTIFCRFHDNREIIKEPWWLWWQWESSHQSSCYHHHTSLFLRVKTCLASPAFPLHPASKENIFSNFSSFKLDSKRKWNIQKSVFMNTLITNWKKILFWLECFRKIFCSATRSWTHGNVGDGRESHRVLISSFSISLTSSEGEICSLILSRNHTEFD